MTAASEKMPASCERGEFAAILQLLKCLKNGQLRKCEVRAWLLVVHAHSTVLVIRSVKTIGHHF